MNLDKTREEKQNKSYQIRKVQYQTALNKESRCILIPSNYTTPGRTEKTVEDFFL